MAKQMVTILKSRKDTMIGEVIAPVLEVATTALLTVLVLGENLAKKEVQEINEALQDANLPYRLTTRLQ